MYPMLPYFIPYFPIYCYNTHSYIIYIHHFQSILIILPPHSYIHHHGTPSFLMAHVIHIILLNINHFTYSLHACHEWSSSTLCNAISFGVDYFSHHVSKRFFTTWRRILEKIKRFFSRTYQSTITSSIVFAGVRDREI